MTDFTTDNPIFNPDEVGGGDTDEATRLIPETPDVSETLQPGATGIGEVLPTGLDERVLRETVDSYYDSLQQDGFTPVGRDYSKFEIDEDGRVRLKAYPDLRLVRISDGKPLALTTIADRFGEGGSNLVKKELGFVEWREQQSALTEKQRKDAADALNATDEVIASSTNLEMDQINRVST